MTKKTPLLLLLAALPLAAAEPVVTTGAFAPGERVAPVAAHAPANVSRMFVKTLVPVAGQAAVDLPAGGSGSLLVLALASGEGSLSSALEGPGGRRLAARQPEADELRRFSIAADELGLDRNAGAAEVVHAARAEAGTWRFSASVPAGVGAVTVAAAEPESPLAMSTWVAPLSRQAGEPVVLHAELSDGGAPVAGARVVARLAGSPAEIPLFDDGRHGDGAEGDGVYAASVPAADLAPGFVAARFDAEGRDARGNAFARTGSGGLVNEPALARLGAVRARFVGDGQSAVLRVAAEADVAVAGDYRLDAIVSGEAAADGSRPALAWGESTVTLAKGAGRVVLEIPAAAFGAVPAAHVDVRLLGLTAVGVAGRVEVDAAR